jgi:hypothetical protein
MSDIAMLICRRLFVDGDEGMVGFIRAHHVLCRPLLRRHHWLRHGGEHLRPEGNLRHLPPTRGWWWLLPSWPRGSAWWPTRTAHLLVVDNGGELMLLVHQRTRRVRSADDGEYGGDDYRTTCKVYRTASTCPRARRVRSPRVRPVHRWIVTDLDGLEQLQQGSANWGLQNLFAAPTAKNRGPK